MLIALYTLNEGIEYGYAILQIRPCFWPNPRSAAISFKTGSALLNDFLLHNFTATDQSVYILGKMFHLPLLVY